MQFLLALVLILNCHHLYKGPKPWDKKVMEHMHKAEPGMEHPEELTGFLGWLKSDVTHKDVLSAKDHGVIGRYWAAAGTAGISLLLLVTVPWWMPAPGRGRQPEVRGPRQVMSGALFLGLLMAAVGAGLYFRAAMLDHSLWNDEEYALRRYSHGGYEEGGKGFEKADWTDALVENNNANNHVLFTVLSRASLGLWRGVSGQPAEAFSEAALRMPSLVAGVLTLALVGMLGRASGQPGAGVAAAWLLALHPWHVRYSVEARGYSLMLLFLCLSLLGMVWVDQGRALRGWLLFALGEAGYLCSFAGAIYLAVALNLLLAAWLLLRRQPRQLLTLAGFNLLGAIPVVLLLLPSVPQWLGFMEHDSAAKQMGTLGLDWFQDLASHLAVGVPFANPAPEAHAGTSWQALSTAHPWMMTSLALALGLSVLAGAVVAFRRGLGLQLAVLGVLAAGTLAILHNATSPHINLSWYFIYLLVPVVCAAPLALMKPKAVPAVALVLLFAVASATPRQVLMDHDRQPIRQVVAMIRDASPDALTATFGVSDRQSRSYDPTVHVLGGVQEIEQFASRSREEKRPFFIYVCGPTETARRLPELSRRVMQGQDFVQVGEAKGTEEMFSYRIYRWQDTP